MTTLTLKHNALRAAHFVSTAPILLAALIGSIPVIIPCVTCRCCKELLARFRSAHASQ